jgi:hypothetical protein
VLGGLSKSPKQHEKDDHDTNVEQIEHRFTSPAPADLTGAALEKLHSEPFGVRS